MSVCWKSQGQINEISILNSWISSHADGHDCVSSLRDIFYGSKDNNPQQDTGIVSMHRPDHSTGNSITCTYFYN